MKTQQFTVIDPLGIHARPASQLVAKATPFASAIEVRTEEKSSEFKIYSWRNGISFKARFSIYTICRGGKTKSKHLRH
ncbi:HPr family phosphocarrier protein [Lysinibacillus sp. MHQ-1]|nr:HPr family phosphocarrier protein [Lysinibacillus sp. MHQ-1]